MSRERAGSFMRFVSQSVEVIQEVVVFGFVWSSRRKWRSSRRMKEVELSTKGVKSSVLVFLQLACGPGGR